MSRYRKIEVRTWADKRFRELSPMPPSGQGLWLFLMTGPHTSQIPGLFRIGRAALAEELNWELEAFDKAFDEVFTQGMVKADFKAKLVWLPNALKHNKPESPNVVRSWRSELDLLPECDLRNAAIQDMREYLESLGASYVEAFEEALSKESRKPSAKPSAKTMANQEQEQEQELTTNPIGLVVGSKAANAPTRPECPHQEIIALYHEVLPMCPKIRDWTASRATHLRARWNEEPRRQNLTYWREFFEYVRGCDFLVGKAKGKSDRPFFADLAWIVKSDSFTKIREGKYAND